MKHRKAVDDDVIMTDKLGMAEEVTVEDKMTCVVLEDKTELELVKGRLDVVLELIVVVVVDTIGQVDIAQFAHVAAAARQVLILCALQEVHVF